MSTLSPQDEATLHIVGGEDVVCRHLGGPSDLLELQPLGPLSGHVGRDMQTGTMALLSVTARGKLSAEKGIASRATGSEVIRFMPLPRAGVGTWRRAHPRAPIVAGVRCTPLLAEPELSVAPIVTVCANLSAGGMLLVRAGRLPAVRRWGLELMLDQRLEMLATTVRITPTHIGVRFDRLNEKPRARLQALVDARLARG